MSINSLGGSLNIKVQTAKLEISSKSAKLEDEKQTVREDSFVKSVNVTSVTYSAPKKLTAKQIEEIKNQHTESMKNMVAQMLGKQAKIADKASGQFDIFEILGADATPETAAAAIAEDGEWGVDAVATRLVDMAISLSGGDSSKAAMLREAVEKGFEAAGLEIGSELPQICKDTFDETMKRFDYWEQNGSMDGYVMQKETEEV